MFDSVKLFTFYLKRNTERKLRIAYKSSCFHYNLSTKVNYYLYSSYLYWLYTNYEEVLVSLNKVEKTGEDYFKAAPRKTNPRYDAYTLNGKKFVMDTQKNYL